MTDPESPLIPRPRTRILPPVPFGLALVFAWWAQGQVDLHLPWTMDAHDQPVLEGMGWMLIGGGLGLMLWSVLTLWRHRTTVNPFGRAQALCVTGPFAWSRNPIYLGDFLILFGGGFVMNSVWPALLAPAIWWLIQHHVIAHEETFLRERFGQPYAIYLQEVPRWLRWPKKTPAQGRG